MRLPVGRQIREFLGKKVGMHWADGGTEAVLPKNLIPSVVLDSNGQFEADGRKFSGLEYLAKGVAFVGEDPGTATTTKAAATATGTTTRSAPSKVSAIASPSKVNVRTCNRLTCVLAIQFHAYLCS